VVAVRGGIRRPWGTLHGARYVGHYRWSILVCWFVPIGRGVKFCYHIKREYGSVITHRHTRVMIWEIRRGVGCVLRRCFCSLLKFSCTSIPV